MAILKTSADTNAGQSLRLTHCIKNLLYNHLKSLIFKNSLLFLHTFKNTTQLLKIFFFVSLSLTNAVSPPFIYSISSKQVFIAVSDFSVPPKKLKPDTSCSIFPTKPRQRSNHHPWAGLTNQIPHSPSTENSQMPGVCPRVGRMLKFRFDRLITPVPLILETLLILHLVDFLGLFFTCEDL